MPESRKIPVEEDDDLLRELFEVWNPLGMDGIFVLLRGYIDESYNPRVFTLSCLVSTGKIWSELSRQWRIVLTSLNKRLKTECRPIISRYHAADCSNFKREFSGWTPDEQRALFADLVKVFARYELGTVAFSVDLSEFHRIIPQAKTEAKPDFQTFLYGMATKFLINRLAHHYCVEYPDTTIALVHDRCGYSGAMSNAFNQQVNDLGFEHKHCFPSFTSVGWEHCIPLQPTDLIAYENFKDAMRVVNPRDRRKSLDLLLDLDSFGGRCQFMGTEAIQKLKAEIPGLSA